MSGKNISQLQNKFIFESGSPQTTINFGKNIGSRLPAGSIIALTGELGCGKTQLSKGICSGLGVPGRYVSSPTFVLVNEYKGKFPVFHMDVYRLNSVEEGFEIGLLDYISRTEAGGIIIVEWAEKMISLFHNDYLMVSFEVLSPRKRLIELTAYGKRFDGLLKDLRK